MISSKVYALHESGNGGIFRIIARIRTVGIYKCAGRFDRFFSFHILRVSASFLSRSRVYSITALCGCLFPPFSFFFIFTLARPLHSSASLRFFPLFLRHVSFFPLFSLFATNRTTRYPYFRLFDY